MSTMMNSILEFIQDERKYYGLYRILLGFFLIYHFGNLLPYSYELFSQRALAYGDTGVLNLIGYFNDKYSIEVFIYFILLSSFLFTVGFYRKIMSFFIWYGHMALMQKNILIMNVSYDFLGWMLFAFIFIPEFEKFKMTKNKSEITEFPRYILLGGFLIMTLGYTFNGYLKWDSTLWRSGVALQIIVPYDRLLVDGSIRDFLISLPESIHQMMTYGTVYLELFCLPLCLFIRTRIFAWIGILFMHIGAFFIFRIKDLSLTLIFFQLLLWPAIFKWPNIVEAAKKNW